MKPKNVELSIEKLVLEGFAIENGERIRASVERELTCLSVEQGVSERLAKNVNIARLKAREIGIEPSANAALVGKQIARAIYGAIKQ